MNMNRTNTNQSILTFFWQHIKPYKWYYMLMMMAPIVSSFYPFAYNYAIKLFLDAMVTQQATSYSDVMFPIVLFVAAQFTLDAVWRISNAAEWMSEPHVRRSIILQSYDYVQHHSYRFFQDNFTGSVSSKLKGILDGYDKFWAEMHHGIAVRIFKIVVNILVLVFVNLYLGLFILAWGLTYIPLMTYFAKRLNRLANAESDARHALIGQMSDKITNILALFSFASRQIELKRLDRQVKDDFMPKQVKMYKYDFAMQIVGGILFNIMFIFILFYMIYLKIHGFVTVGDFALVFGLALVVGEDIWIATNSLLDFSRAMGDTKSALSVIYEPHERRDVEDAGELQIISPEIEFHNINFDYYKSQVVFNQLNLHLRAGEKVGLVGHSGAGKSTLVNLLMRYFDPNAGKICIDGQDISQVTEDSLRASIAVIPQDTMLFHRSLMDNIRYGNPAASDDEVIQASRLAHIHEFISTLPEGYDTLVGERGVKLSGGQRQRVSIARAILKDAPIMILDEATSSLDSQTEQLIQDSLNFYIEDKNKTVIAIAHRLSTLKHMDRVIVLDKGSVLEEGTHDELMGRPNSLYKKLWEYQAI